MEELFRFSVLRPATRSQVIAAPLGRPADVTVRTFGFPDFQQGLRDKVQSLVQADASPAVIWRELENGENGAITFVLNHAESVLTNELWTRLQSFLENLRQRIEDWSSSSIIDVTDFTEAFAEMRSQPTLAAYRNALADLFIAFMIIRRGGTSNLDATIRTRNLWHVAELLSDKPTLAEVGDRIKAIDLIEAGPEALAPPSDANTPALSKAAVLAAFELALNKTLLLPPALFSPFRKPVHGVGFRDFFVVRQHIRRYELAEIARIENILRGETRLHTQKHTLSNERETFFEREKTTQEDTELTTTDHIDIKNETQNQIKEDTKVDAGVHAQYDGGSFDLQADLSVSYARSTDETKKHASNIAKDVTQKAVNKVTEKVTQRQITKIIETFEEVEEQSFKNGAGENVSGLYQWVQKIYLAQVFSLGPHLLFDVMVPEPGASLLALATIPPADQEPPVPPHPLGSPLRDPVTNKPVLDEKGRLQLDKPLMPNQLLDRPPTDKEKEDGMSYYGDWIAKFQVTGVEPPPPETITVAKTLSSESSSKNVLLGEVLKLDDGYGAYAFTVRVLWRATEDNKADSQVDAIIGPRTLFWKQGSTDTTGAISPNSVSKHYGASAGGAFVPDPATGTPLRTLEERAIGIAVQVVYAELATVNIEVLCKRTPERLAKWQLDTYGKIAAAWQKLDASNNRVFWGRKRGMTRTDVFAQGDIWPCCVLCVLA